MASTNDLLAKQTLLTKQRTATVTAAAAPLLGGTRTLLLTFPLGTRVLDLVTGEEGTVVNGKRENVIIPPATNAGG
jgi:septum formation inhibitor-activating ATPase MinD